MTKTDSILLLQVSPDRVDLILTLRYRLEHIKGQLYRRETGALDYAGTIISAHIKRGTEVSRECPECEGKWKSNYLHPCEHCYQGTQHFTIGELELVKAFCQECNGSAFRFVNGSEIDCGCAFGLTEQFLKLVGYDEDTAETIMGWIEDVTHPFDHREYLVLSRNLSLATQEGET